MEQENRWLWSHFVQREAFQLLESAWPRLDANVSKRLINAILSGPSREIFRDDTDENVYVEIRNDMVRARLECLERAGRALPLDAESRLAELRPSQRPVEVPEDRSHFASWTAPVSGDPTLYRFDPNYDLRRCGKEEQIRIIAEITPESPYWPTWRLMVREGIQGATELLVDIAGNSKWPVAAWKELLKNVPTSGQATALWPQLCTALRPRSDLSAVSNEVSWTLREISKSLAIEEEDCLWTLWDRIEPAIAKSELDLGNDILSQALNSASGALAETVLNRMDVRNPESGADIPDPIWDRLARLVKFQQTGLLPSQALLASRLSWLFELKREWVQDNFLPNFDWERNPNADALWQGYLWQFGMPPDLWPFMKKDFLEAVRRFPGSKEEENAVAWFTAICIRQPLWIDPREATKTLQALTPSGRSAVARTLWQFMESAGESADALWRERVGPWLQRSWPRDQNLRTPSMSVHLALAAIHTRQQFPVASQLVLEVIVPSPDFTRVTWKLNENRSSIPDTYPRELLRILGALFDSTSQSNDQSLRGILQRIVQACPDCSSNSDYKRLHDWDLTH
jgi:hypothetical protein